MKGSVKIPKSDLAKLIVETNTLHHRATELLSELEIAYLKQPITEIGSWRQDTSKWRKKSPID